MHGAGWVVSLRPIQISNVWTCIVLFYFVTLIIIPGVVCLYYGIIIIDGSNKINTLHIFLIL